MGASDEIDAAVERFLDEGAEGDLNEHLDGLGLEHPSFEHRRSNSPEREGIIGCPYGQHAAYNRVFDKHHGWHFVWYCTD